MTPAEDIAITGIAAMNAAGLSADEYWDKARRGKSALTLISEYGGTEHYSHVGGRIHGFDERVIPGRLIPQTDRMTKLALACGEQAIANARLTDLEATDYRMGVVTSASYGGLEYGETQLHRQWTLGPQHVSAYQSFAWFYAANSGQLSIRHKLTGPAGVAVADDCGGAYAFVVARRRIRQGHPLMLVGGADSPMSPWGWVASTSDRLRSTKTEPTNAYAPFTPTSAGSVLGEGAAMLIFEDPAHAHQRGADIYGFIRGLGFTFGKSADALRTAIHYALTDADLHPEAVDLILPDAAAISDMDATELSVLASVFADNPPPLAVPKVLTGRLGSATLPTDAVFALKAIHSDSDFLCFDHHLFGGAKLRRSTSNILIVSRSLLGHNTTVVISNSQRKDGK